MSVALQISPKDLLEVDPAIYLAMKSILQERAQQSKTMRRK